MVHSPRVRAALDVPRPLVVDLGYGARPDTTVEMAERLRRSCEEHRFPGPAGPLALTVSGGIAAMDMEHLLSGDELVRRADAMLYEAKKRGRNRICAWREP